MLVEVMAEYLGVRVDRLALEIARGASEQTVTLVGPAGVVLGVQVTAPLSATEEECHLRLRDALVQALVEAADRPLRALVCLAPLDNPHVRALLHRVQ